MSSEQPGHRSVVMLCQGTEVYGVGTVLKLYARGMPGTRFVCMTEGPMLDWLRGGGYRVDVVEGLVGFHAGGSLGTILRVPFAMRRARRDAGLVHALLKAEGGKPVIHTHWLPQQFIGGFMQGYGYRVVWHIHNNLNPKRLCGMGIKLNHCLARWGADLIIAVSNFISGNWRGGAVCPCVQCTTRLRRCTTAPMRFRLVRSGRWWLVGCVKARGTTWLWRR
ncbi:MAG: hypothetical protein ACREYE_09815 [Gammaproteobacteria bacterium]